MWICEDSKLTDVGLRFQEEHINLLWNAAVGKGKQERITDTIYELFDNLTKDLEPSLVAFLIQKIRSTRVFDTKTLNLMRTLTLHQLLEDDDNVSPCWNRLHNFNNETIGSKNWWFTALLGHHSRRPFHLSRHFKGSDKPSQGSLICSILNNSGMACTIRKLWSEIDVKSTAKVLWRCAPRMYRIVILCPSHLNFCSKYLVQTLL